MDNNAPTYQEMEKDLNHQYWIDGRLGKGAYGQFLKAKCKDDGKVYTIKVLREIENRYQKRELKALKKLNQLEEPKRNFVNQDLNCM